MYSTLVQILDDPSVVVLLLATGGLVIFYAMCFCVRLTLQAVYENAFMDYVKELIYREQKSTNQRKFRIKF